jgi:hypothetical protein
VTALDAARLAEAEARLRSLGSQLPRRARSWARARLRLLRRALHSPVDASELLADLRLSLPAGLRADAALLAQVAWLHWPNRRGARHALPLLARWRAELRQIASDDEEAGGSLAPACLELLRLEGERLAGPLVRWLGTPSHHVPMCRVDRYLSAHLDVVRVHLNARRDQRPQLAEPDWPAEPCAHPDGVGQVWTRDTLAQPSSLRRGRLRLLGLILPGELGVSWARWWARVRDATGRVRRLVEDLRRGHPCSRRLWRARRRLERLRHARPAQGIPHRLRPALKGPLTAHAGLARAAARALRHVPALDGSASPRLELLERWSSLREGSRSNAQAQRLIRLMRAWGSFHRRADGALARRARGLVGRSTAPATPYEAAILSGRLSVNTLAPVLDALAWWSRDPSAPLYPWDALTLLLDRGVTPHDAARLLREVARDAGTNLQYYDEPVLALCCELAPREPKAFAAALDSLQELSDDLGDEAERALPALRRLLAEDPARLGHVAGHQGHGRPLWLRLTLVAGLGADLPTPAERSPGRPPGRWSRRDPSWLTRYPEALHEKLRQLIRLDPDRAERVAKEQLGRTFPDPADLRRQLRALEATLASGAPDPAPLRARRRRLAQRLATPPQAGPERLAKLSARLDRRVRLARCRRLQAACDDVVRAQLTCALGAEPPASWLSETLTLRMLAHLVWLPRDSRRLGLRLLRRRLGPAPWDLRDAPRNRAFVARLEARGLELTPWLHDAPSTTHRTQRGLAVTLTLSRDPLQILLMGEPFGTCLSPGGENFWSSVSNAADANKQVLFARDGRGRVHGRCLLALTGDGDLLTYHAYAHDSLPGFAALAGAYAADLATRLGTAVAPDGTVETLVANDWYDDGVTQLEGATPVAPALLAALSDLPPAEARDRLERELGPRLRTRAVLSCLLAHPSVVDRPELIAALEPHLVESSLPPDQYLDAVQLTRPAHADAARALLQPLLSGDRWRRLRRSSRGALLEATLALRGPQAALRLLRRTRRGPGRGWRRETPRCLLVAAKAQEALQRPRQALTLYRRAVDSLQGPFLAECRARIKALEKTPASV